MASDITYVATAEGWLYLAVILAAFQSSSGRLEVRRPARCRASASGAAKFALVYLPGNRFAPRIRNLADRRLYVSDCRRDYPTLSGLIGGVLNQKWIRSRWDEILREQAQGAASAHGAKTIPQFLDEERWLLKCREMATAI